MVETAVRADKSQTLTVLSADLWVYQIGTLGSGVQQLTPRGPACRLVRFVC